jgi:hypothetical protein
VRALPVVVVALLVAACGGGAATPEPEPAAGRLTAGNRAALDLLLASSPGAVDPAHLGHDVAGHDVWGPTVEPALDADVAAALDAEWARAQAAAAELATPEDAVAAGYQRSSAELPGIGAHYVNWGLVDEPFDPARPSMLLYDESEVRPDRLAGFSYWLRSPGAAPEGFAGPADHWHMHHGLCFVDGLLRAEEVVEPTECAGDWLAGTDLWMGHAWVAPGLENPWGRFAPRNPLVCPAASEPVGDFARCPDPLPDDPAEAATLDANALLCVIPGQPGAAGSDGSG